MIEREIAGKRERESKIISNKKEQVIHIYIIGRKIERERKRERKRDLALKRESTKWQIKDIKWYWYANFIVNKWQYICWSK